MIDDVYGMENPSKGSKAGNILKGAGGVVGALAPIAGAIYGMFGETKDQQDLRQQKQQRALTNIQSDANKEAAKYSQDLQYDMWKKTGYGPQVQQMEEAGLNPALMYGMGGGGGQTTGSASASGVSGGSAANSAQTQANQQAMGMQIAQLGLMKAQKENVEADTENKKAETENKGVQTQTGKLNLDTATKTQEATIQTIQENAAKALADAVQSQQQQVITEETMKEQIKTIQEKALTQILTNKNLTTENKIKEAEETIKQFEAKMAESGISPKTPWYMKLIIDQLEKFHINPLKQ